MATFDLAYPQKIVLFLSQHHNFFLLRISPNKTVEWWRIFFTLYFYHPHVFFSVIILFTLLYMAVVEREKTKKFGCKKFQKKYVNMYGKLAKIWIKLFGRLLLSLRNKYEKKISFVCSYKLSSSRLLFRDFKIERISSFSDEWFFFKIGFGLISWLWLWSLSNFKMGLM